MTVDETLMAALGSAALRPAACESPVSVNKSLLTTFRLSATAVEVPRSSLDLPTSADDTEEEKQWH